MLSKKLSRPVYFFFLVFPSHSLSVEATAHCLQAKVYTSRFSASRVSFFLSISLLMVVYVKEGEACEIDEGTRPALDLAAKLLGVAGDMLEKAMVSKMMAVRGWAQAGHIIRASFRSCCCCRASNTALDFRWYRRWWR